MDHTYWHKQTPEAPLFPNLLWSRPENKAQAGKVLIIGGNAHGFSAPAQAYTYAIKAGAGTVRVVLPGSLQKTVGKVFAVGEYAPSTPSGSFSQQALADLLGLSDWADAILLAGDFGRNSETAIALENLCSKCTGPLILYGDSIDYFTTNPQHILNRQNTLLVPSFAQLQKLGSNIGATTAFTSKLDFLHLVEALHTFSTMIKPTITLEHEHTVFTASADKVSTTKTATKSGLELATVSAVWIAQNPTKLFEAATTASISEK